MAPSSPVWTMKKSQLQGHHTGIRETWEAQWRIWRIKVKLGQERWESMSEWLDEQPVTQAEGETQLQSMNMYDQPAAQAKEAAASQPWRNCFYNWNLGHAEPSAERCNKGQWSYSWGGHLAPPNETHWSVSIYFGLWSLKVVGDNHSQSIICACSWLPWFYCAVLDSMLTSLYFGLIDSYWLHCAMIPLTPCWHFINVIVPRLHWLCWEQIPEVLHLQLGNDKGTWWCGISMLKWTPLTLHMWTETGYDPTDLLGVTAVR